MAAARVNLPYRYCFLLVVLFATRENANAVSLPFFEGFDTPTADAVSTYTDLTYDDGGAGFDPSYVVNADGILRVGSGGFPQYQAFGVYPDPVPTGEIIIKLDMGWDGSIADPPVGPGFGGVGIRLGTKIEDGGATGSKNNIGFHPVYPGGAPLRVEGPGGFPGTDMGWTAQRGVLNHMEIDSFPDGTFHFKVVDGTNPANVYTASFVSPEAYGGEIAILAWAGGIGLYDNFSIQVAGAPVVGDYNNNGVVDAADYVVWRDSQNTSNVLPNDPIGGMIGSAQYDQWRSHFGQSSAGGSSLSPGVVPESASAVLLLVGFGLSSVHFRRRTAQSI